jgi:hypothetical protein
MRALLPLLFLLACTSEKSDADGEDSAAEDTDTDTVVDTDTVEAPDADGDGYSDEEDCDDANVRINPGASERCNEVDDDCDGRVDEAAFDQQLMYPDEDGDGFGVDGQQSLACPGEPNLSLTTDDCDDTDAATYPNAPEEDCEDPTDRNCDGVAPTFDSDEDGTPQCDDCDDTDANVYPGAPNVCNDCDDSTIADVLFSSDFSTAPSELSLNGDATVDGTALQLTANAEDSAGAALFVGTLPASGNLDISFNAQMCCYGGDDGIAFAFLSGDELETAVGGTGASLGFLGLHGYAVGIDTSEDGASERTDNGVTLLGSTELLMATATIDDFDLDDGEPHDFHIVYSWADGVATVRVSAEGEQRLTASWDQADVPMRLGVTGGTSASFHEYQSVDDLVISQCE